MKTLLLMRHAKSSWDNPGLRDFDRPLNERGLKAAPLMGRYLRAQGIAPDLIVSSPAQRAQQTAQLVKEAARCAAPIRYEAAIYDANLNALLKVLQALDKTTKTVLLVGHNPSFSGFEDCSPSAGNFSRESMGRWSGKWDSQTASISDVRIPSKSRAAPSKPIVFS